VESKLKKLVEFKELSNLYIDLSEDILKNLIFDSSIKDKQNQLLFINCIENSISSLADHIHTSFSNQIESINHLNFKYKWVELSKLETIKNVIQKELDNDGMIEMIEDSKKRILLINDDNLISSNKENDLKKFSLILNKYKTFNELLRKILEEC
tara:strand:- start:564 stop:1025 length:462 start_codon:yes stop_codon:yes gene_type:complete